VQDITERIDHEQELEKRSEVEQQIVGIVSHDLRNPIAAIALLADSLSREVQDRPRALSMARRLVRSATRAARFVEQVLDFTQARLGDGIPMRKEEQDLVPALEGVLDDLRTEYGAERIRTVGERHVVGTWDAARLAQAVANLVANALKYSQRDTAVTVTIGRDAGALLLEVHNDGPAIEPGMLRELFQPLKRGAQDVAARGSIGLGLFIVEQIVHAHGGTVSVSSTRERGTCFSVRVPLDAEAVVVA